MTAVKSNPVTVILWSIQGLEKVCLSVIFMSLYCISPSRCLSSPLLSSSSFSSLFIHLFLPLILSNLTSKSVLLLVLMSFPPSRSWNWLPSSLPPHLFFHFRLEWSFLSEKKRKKRVLQSEWHVMFILFHSLSLSLSLPQSCNTFFNFAFLLFSLL